MPKHKLVRVTTVPVSLHTLLDGQLRFMNDHYNVFGISSEKGEILESVAKKEGIAVKSVEMTRRISPLKDLKAVWTLYKLFQKRKTVNRAYPYSKSGNDRNAGWKTSRCAIAVAYNSRPPFAGSKRE